MEPAQKAMLAPTPMSVSSVLGNTGGNSALNSKVPQNTIQTILPTTQTNPLQLTKDQSISTPIRIYSLTHYLQNYESELANFLIQGFTFGFKIPYKGPRQFRLSRNLSSIEGKEHILQQRIDQELKHQRIAGPFCKPPFPNIQISPLGLVPKKSPGEFRLIHHLSFPEKASINHHIPKEFCTVQYQSIHNAIEIIKQVGKGALLAKIDIENAYKQISIHPSDFELLGFMINNQYYYDKTLPFGLSYSCNLFEKFSTALQWILTTKFGVQHCVHMLDDFLFIGAPSSPECYSSLLAFYVLAKDIGLPIKSEKTVYPTTILTFLGLELDTVQFQVRLPNDKLIQLQSEIKKFQNRHSVTLQELQSLIGMLNYACCVVPPGRTFLRRLINLTIGLKKPHHHRNLNLEAKADLKAWQVFLESFNGKAFFPSHIVHSTSSLHLFTDASNLGFGGIFGTKWFSEKFSQEWLSCHISVREFLPIVIAFELWGSCLANSTVVIHLDNSAVVHVINKTTSKDTRLMQLWRRLMILSLSHNIHFQAQHIPGVANTAADLLSRLQVPQFLIRFPNMDKTPTLVPASHVKI